MRNKGNEEADRKERRCGTKGTRKQTERNEDAEQRKRAGGLLETKKRTAVDWEAVR